MKTLTATLCFLFIGCTLQAQWLALDNGISGLSPDTGINTLKAYDGSLFAGGNFNRAGTTNADNIAKWTGSTWQNIGNINGSVNTICIYQNQLYVGGDFTAIDGLSSKRFARWDGDNNVWYSEAGINGAVYSMVEFEGELYVAGEFTRVDDLIVSNIAKWNGTEWSEVGEGLNDIIRTLHVYNGELYAGGDFSASGITPMQYLAKYDNLSSSWESMPIELNNAVNVLTTFKSKLYAGGAFTHAQGKKMSHIAAWNGTHWSPLGQGTDGNVQSMVRTSSDLYIGGEFTSSSQKEGQLLKWNGSKWESMNFEFHDGGSVNALAILNDNLYVGGEFALNNSRNISRLDISINEFQAPGIESVVVKSVGNSTMAELFPNPNNGMFQLKLANNETTTGSIDIINSLTGQIVLRYDNQDFVEGRIEINATGQLPFGLYHVRIQTTERTVTQRMTIY